MANPFKKIMKEPKRRKLNSRNPKPGAYLGVPADTYHGANALNNSSLKKMLTSPKHFQLPREDRPALLYGRLYHELTLTPRQFKSNWAIYEGAARRGKAWEEFQAEHAGKDICTVKEHTEAKALAKAVRQSDLGTEYLKGAGHNEVSLVWHEEVDGMPLTLKCRTDRLAIRDGVPCVVDLKGTTASNKDEFARDAAKYHYEMQAAWYMRGVEQALGVELSNEDFVFLAVEKSTLITCAYWLPEDAVHYGRQKMDGALRRYVQCVRENRWPAPNNGKAEELTNYFPRPFEGMEVVDMAGLEVEPLEVAA